MGMDGKSMRRSPTLADLGEDRIVAELAGLLPRVGSQAAVGIGDDCAAIGGARDRVWRLLKTDAVVEGIHFAPGEDWRRVGWKALCRPISDIAAMGGQPEEALVTIAAQLEMPMADLRRFYEGLAKAATAYEVAVVGGELSRSPGAFFCSVALTGSVERKLCVRRGGGRPGDALFVTGRLGGSLAGKHLDFTPRLAEAQWLVRNARVTAMMDLSDGLAKDLPRLAAASGCGYRVELAAIPRTRGCSVEEALADGEDFELLFGARGVEEEELLAKWGAVFPKLRLTKIGVLTRAEETQNLGETLGHDHFQKP